MNHPHFPPSFGRTPKPHIAKVNGEWLTMWPTGACVSREEYESFNPYMRKLNGIADPRPGAFFIDPVQRAQ